MAYSVKLAYNSTSSIPAVGGQRITLTLPLANDAQIERSFEETVLVDQSIDHDIWGVHRVLIIFFDPVAFNANRSFLESFMSAKHTWATYGNFQDTANSANDNLCKCVVRETEVKVAVESALKEGYRLVSEKVF